MNEFTITALNHRSPLGLEIYDSGAGGNSVLRVTPEGAKQTFEGPATRPFRDMRDAFLEEISQQLPTEIPYTQWLSHAVRSLLPGWPRFFSSPEVIEA